VSRYIPTIGVDYGVKPVRVGDFEVRRRRAPPWSPVGAPGAAPRRGRATCGGGAPRVSCLCGGAAGARSPPFAPARAAPQVRVNLWDMAGPPEYLEVGDGAAA
jgi:hypothetical protein